MTTNANNSFAFKSLCNSMQAVNGGNKESRLVVVRYYLDRAGHDVNDSAARLWFNVPIKCRPNEIRTFLSEQGIYIDGLIVEIYLERFGSFMLLEACEAAEIEWNFETANCSDPGFLLIRLTDTSQTGDGFNQNASRAPTNANTTPMGLLAFSMMLGLESVVAFMHLSPGSVGAEFLLTWYPYAFFIGGLLQVFVGIFETFRNNIYGSIAFLTFGCVWLANGTVGILNSHFTSSDSPAADYMSDDDKWGSFALTLYLLAFSCTLLVQTFVNDKLSTLVVSMLVAKYIFQLFAPWYKTMEWIQVILQCINAVIAFAIFFIEFTNQVYNRHVFDTFKWNDESPMETFAAPGAQQTLLSKAHRLRTAQYGSIHDPRYALPEGSDPATVKISIEKQE